MADAKVRCTTCYNVFNTAKKEGQEVTCPMCDSSFTVLKTTLVGDIRQSINKVTKGISEYVKEKTGTAENKEAFTEIDGKKYDRELIEIAEQITENKEEIGLEGSKQLFLKIKDYDDDGPPAWLAKIFWTFFCLLGIWASASEYVHNSKSAATTEEAPPILSSPPPKA